MTVIGRPAAGADEPGHLTLYIAGRSPKSLRATANLTRLYEDHLAGRFEIEIVDLVEQPERARIDDIIAIPTLVRRLPGSSRRTIGDLSRTERVLDALELHGDPVR